MKKKKILFYILGALIIAIVFIVLIIFIFYKGLNYADSGLFEQKTVTDIAYYDEMWDNPEKHEDYNKSILFPKSVENLKVTDFLFVYNVHLFITEWQIELVVKYDEDYFENEVERIKSVCKGSPVYGETEYFDKPAYASMWDYDSCYEYAIVDEKNSEIVYIYFQYVYVDLYEFKIEEKYIPKGYRNTSDTSEPNYIFSAYENLTPFSMKPMTNTLG